MKMLDDYLALQARIYDYFGYVEGWRVFPLDDCRQFYWFCDGDEVVFAETESELKRQSGEHYVNHAYHQRHLDEWVHEGKDFTMILADTQADGNKLLQVFDNAKRRQGTERL